MYYTIKEMMQFQNNFNITQIIFIILLIYIVFICMIGI